MILIRSSTVLNIFDALVKPIASYNCDVWIGYKSCYQKNQQCLKLQSKDKMFNKIFTRFSKFVLGVHSKTSNVAVFS